MQVLLQVLLAQRSTCRNFEGFLFMKMSISNIEKWNLVLVLQEKLAVRE